MVGKPAPDAPPATSARYGYLAFQCREEAVAERCLEQVLAGLPNLSTPWLLLERIYEKQGRREEAVAFQKKHRLLTRGGIPTARNGMQGRHGPPRSAE